MDLTDLNILKMLRQDSRESLANIALNLGVSKATVSRRISKLEQQGYISGYTILTSPTKLGVARVGATQDETAGGASVRRGALGHIYQNEDVIIRQGEIGDCMYVIQEGEVEVLRNVDGKHLRLAVLGPGEFFGDMALFERIVRSATVRAIGTARVVTIDKATLLRRIQEDPGLAFRMLESLRRRIRTERMTAPAELE